MVKKSVLTIISAVASVVTAMGIIMTLLYNISVNSPNIGLNDEGLPEFISDYGVTAYIYVKNVGGRNGEFDLKIVNLDNFQFSDFNHRPSYYDAENNPTWEYNIMSGDDVTISFTIKTEKQMVNIPENTVYEIRLIFNGSERSYLYINTGASFQRMY